MGGLITVTAVWPVGSQFALYGEGPLMIYIITIISTNTSKATPPGNAEPQSDRMGRGRAGPGL